ncbi:MAG: hypothetical protein AB2N28_2060 [Candidatus Phytoplasma solani]
MKWFKEWLKRKTKKGLKKAKETQEEQEDIKPLQEPKEPQKTPKEEPQDIKETQEEQEDIIKKQLNNLNEEIDKLTQERDKLTKSIKPKIDLAKPLGWFLILATLFYFALPSLVARYEKVKELHSSHYYTYYYKKGKSFVKNTYHKVKDTIKDFLVLGSDSEVQQNALNDEELLEKSKWYLKPFIFTKKMIKMVPTLIRKTLIIAYDLMYKYVWETLKYSYYYIVYDWNAVYNQYTQQFEWQPQSDYQLKIPQSQKNPLYQTKIKALIIKGKGFCFNYYLKLKTKFNNFKESLTQPFNSIKTRWHIVTGEIKRENKKYLQFNANNWPWATRWIADGINAVAKPADLVINLLISVVEWMINLIMLFVEVILFVIPILIPIVIIALGYIFAFPVIQTILKLISDILSFVFNFLNDALKLAWSGLKFLFKDIICFALVLIYKEVIKPFLKVLMRFLRKTIFVVLKKAFKITKFVVKYITSIIIKLLVYLLVKYLTLIQGLRLKEDIEKDQTIIIRGVEQ